MDIIYVIIVLTFPTYQTFPWQVFKAAEASVVISKHENMCRVKLYWMTAAVDTQTRRAVIEFKNTYSTQSDAFICRYGVVMQCQLFGLVTSRFACQALASCRHVFIIERKWLSI